jgi:hypothetical protein
MASVPYMHRNKKWTIEYELLIFFLSGFFLFLPLAVNAPKCDAAMWIILYILIISFVSRTLIFLKYLLLDLILSTK